MSNPLALVTKPKTEDAIKAAVLEILREALAQAEAGEVDEVTVILSHPDGQWSERRSGAMDFAETIGRLEIIKQSWIDAFNCETRNKNR